jgi:ankyrin repeat protein
VNQNTEAAKPSEVALDFVAYATTQQFKTVLQDIDRLAESLDGSKSEVFLLRALNAIDSYGATSDLQQPFAEPEISIVEKLITIYEEQGDPAAEQDMLERRMRLRVNSGVLSVAHESRVPSLLASRYVATSHRLSDIIGRIGVPQKYSISGADPFPPLHRALESGHAEASKLLIENTGGQFGEVSELEVAAYPAVAGHGDFLDADSFTKIDFLQRNVLHVAVESDNLWLLDLPAISNPSLISGRDRHGRSPILLAAANGSLEAVKKLVHAGATLTDRDENNFSILMLAVNSGNSALVKYLLEKGVSPNDYTSFMSPLQVAARTGHLAICELLLEAGASSKPAALSTHGKTAAQVAEEAGFSELAKTLRTHEVGGPVTPSSTTIEAIT